MHGHLCSTDVYGELAPSCQVAYCNLLKPRCIWTKRFPGPGDLMCLCDCKRSLCLTVPMLPYTHAWGPWLSRLTLNRIKTLCIMYFCPVFLQIGLHVYIMSIVSTSQGEIDTLILVSLCCVFVSYPLNVRLIPTCTFVYRMMCVSGSQGYSL